MQKGCLYLDNAEKQVLRTLDCRGVRYVVIGGHAVNAHGYYRPVNDLDIVIEPTEANARSFMLALSDLGFGGTRITVENLSQPKKQVRVARYGVDILTSIESIAFSELFECSMTVSVEGINVPVASLDHLLSMKLTSKRPEDRRDYEALLSTKRHSG